MESNSSNQSLKDNDGGVSVSDLESTPLSLKTKFLKVPLYIYFIVIFAFIGGYAVLKSHADAVTQTQVWNTAANWNTGTLNDTTVTGNSVQLAKAIPATSSSPASTSTGVDLALNRSAYASSTNTGNNYTKTAQVRLYPKYVDDGNLTTRWGSKYSDPQWIYVDLGQTYNISEVKLTWEVAYAKAYQIQVSNNARQWTTIYSTSTGTGNVNDLTGLKGSGRYVRMYGTQRGTQYGYSLWEMGVYGTPTTTTTPTTTYDTSGSITLNYNASTPATWTSLAGLTTLPTGTAVSYEARTSSNGSTWSSWTSVPSSGSLSALANSQYIQIMANLSTTATTATPLLNQLTLNYSINIANPTVSLTAGNTTITSGNSTTLAWTSANATSCTASGAWSGSEATSGSVTISPTTTSTYDLSCSGAGGSGSATPVTVTVNPVTTGTGTTTGCTYNGAVAPCIGSTTTGASGWGTPIFDDEFSTNTLNSQWQTGWFDSSTPSGPVNGGENNCYSPSQVSLGSNGLDLKFIKQATTCKGVSQPYDTGLVTTDPFDGEHGPTSGIDPANNYHEGLVSGLNNTGFTFTYGFVEAQVYLPPSGSQIANWPAVWAVTPPPDSSGNPTYGEMDIMEGLNGSACYHFHSNSGAPGGCATGNFSGWHTFAADWQPGTVTYYYDGKNVGTLNSSSSGAITSGPMYLILNNSSGQYGLSPSTAPTDMLVRYVRVWQ